MRDLEVGAASQAMVVLPQHLLLRKLLHADPMPLHARIAYLFITSFQSTLLGRPEIESCDDIYSHCGGCSSENLLAKISEMMAISLMRMLRAGPEVSFRGSPTVSPTTAALCTSDPFIIRPFSSKRAPLSMYFLALSQAPPVFAAEIAICTPLTMAPGRNPARMIGPKAKPSRRGEKMT
jgi:hypothetical protein